MVSIITYILLNYGRGNALLISSQHRFFSKCFTLVTQLSYYNNWFKTLDSGDWIELFIRD